MTDIILLFALLAPMSLLLQRLLAITPQAGPAVWQAALLSFSIPSWWYFILSDQSRHGTTYGKRLWHVRVIDPMRPRLSLRKAVGRTAIKLLPWELTHLVFVFASSSVQWNHTQMIVLISANLLLIVYYGLAIVTRGQRSVHDCILGTVVFLRRRES